MCICKYRLLFVCVVFSLPLPLPFSVSRSTVSVCRVLCLVSLDSFFKWFYFQRESGSRSFDFIEVSFYRGKERERERESCCAFVIISNPFRIVAVIFGYSMLCLQFVWIGFNSFATVQFLYLFGNDLADFVFFSLFCSEVLQFGCVYKIEFLWSHSDFVLPFALTILTKNFKKQRTKNRQQ